MIKVIYRGSSEKRSYKTKEFHASIGNVVFMSEEAWEKINEEGDAKLFEKVESIAKKFPLFRTVSPGVPFEKAKIKQLT